jgi:hypothetical protein
MRHFDSNETSFPLVSSSQQRAPESGGMFQYLYFFRACPQHIKGGKTTKRQLAHAFCSEVRWRRGFASKPFGVKNEPQKINGWRFIRKTKNIEKRTSQTRQPRDFATN